MSFKKTTKEVKSMNVQQLKWTQNFLKDPLLVEKLVRLSSISKKDLVVEIGPGKGIITRVLAKIAKRVITVEKDERLYRDLKNNLRAKNVEIVLGDFLNYRLPRESYKVFSNIPFIITAEIIRKLVQNKHSPEACYLILQKEPAFKYSGRPYGPERLQSLFLKPYFEPKILYYFKKEDFEPSPRVEVVLWGLKKRKTPLIPLEKRRLWEDFVSYGFVQRNKNLKSAFKKVFTYNQWKRLARDLNFSISVTTRELSFPQWLGVFKFFLTLDSSKKMVVLNTSQRLKREQSRLEKIHRSRKRGEQK